MIAFDRQWILAMPPRTGSTALIHALRQGEQHLRLDGFHHYPHCEYRATGIHAALHGFELLTLYRAPLPRFRSTWAKARAGGPLEMAAMGITGDDIAEWVHSVLDLIEDGPPAYSQGKALDFTDPMHRITSLMPCRWWGCAEERPCAMTMDKGLVFLDTGEATGLGAAPSFTNSHGREDRLMNAMLRDRHLVARVNLLYAGDHARLALQNLQTE